MIFLRAFLYILSSSFSYTKFNWSYQRRNYIQRSPALAITEFTQGSTGAEFPNSPPSLTDKIRLFLTLPVVATFSRITSVRMFVCVCVFLCACLFLLICVYVFVFLSVILQVYLHASYLSLSACVRLFVLDDQFTSRTITQP